MTKKKSVLIVDDHPVFREGLKTLINSKPDYDVTAEASNAEEARHLALKIEPDIITIDLSLPDGSGITLISDLSPRLPESSILVVSIHSKLEYITGAFKAGASGYIVKEAASENILMALDAISKGEAYIDSSISMQVVKGLTEKTPKKASISNGKYDSLTSREQEVLALLAEGNSTKDIGEKLSISPKTVKNHRSNIYAKLGCNGIVELIRYATRIGVIDVDLWK